MEFGLHNSVIDAYTTRALFDRVVVVTGGRETVDPDLAPKMTALLPLGIRRLVHGDARGFDRACAAWAKGKIPEIKPYPYIGKLGRAGGNARNTQMLREEDPDYLVAGFGGTGTGNCMMQAHSRGIPILVIGAGGLWTRWSPVTGEYR